MFSGARVALWSREMKLAQPESMSLIWMLEGLEGLSAEKMMLQGRRSRWEMPREWQYCSARRIWKTTQAMTSSRNTFSLICCRPSISVVPENGSHTMITSLRVRNASITRTMLGCSSCSSSATSRVSCRMFTADLLLIRSVTGAPPLRLVAAHSVDDDIDPHANEIGRHSTTRYLDEIFLPRIAPSRSE